MQDLDQITLNYHDALDGFLALQPELDEVMRKIESPGDSDAEDGHDADSLSDLFQRCIAALKALRRATGRFRFCLKRMGGTIEIAALSGNRGSTIVDVSWTYQVQTLCILCGQKLGFADQALEAALQTGDPSKCVSHLREIDRLRQRLCMDLLGAHWCVATPPAPHRRQAGDAEARRDPRADYIGALDALRIVGERLRIWLDEDGQGGDDAPDEGVPREYLSCYIALIRIMESIRDKLARLYTDADAFTACLAADYGPQARGRFTPSVCEALLNAWAMLDDAPQRMRRAAAIARQLIEDSGDDDDSGGDDDSGDDDLLDDDCFGDDSGDGEFSDDENTLDISGLDLPDDSPSTLDESPFDTAPGGGRISRNTRFIHRDFIGLLRELRDDLDATIRALDCRADS